MKISIDTKEDSHEDIKKVIKMLQHLVGESPFTNQPNIFEDPGSIRTSEQQGNVFGNMFDTKTTKEDNGESEQEEEKELPEVIPY